MAVGGFFGMHASLPLGLLAGINFSLPQDANTNLLMLMRWIHFLAGFVWIGLLYFFNLVSIPSMKQLDPGTRAKIMPVLILRALQWFRFSALVTVLMGFGYWSKIVASDAHNAGTSGGGVFGSFFLVWTVVWAIQYAMVMPLKGALDKGAVLAVLNAILLVAGAWLFLHLNSHGWESNRLLAIGIGGGLGWVMMLNVWGVVWRINKKLIRWTRETAETGKPMPEQAARLSRQAFLISRISFWMSLPLLFFMGAASHYPMFGATSSVGAFYPPIR
jgi:uncharacterized membrane protein